MLKLKRCGVNIAGGKWFQWFLLCKYFILTLPVLTEGAPRVQMYLGTVYKDFGMDR